MSESSRWREQIEAELRAETDSGTGVHPDVLRTRSIGTAYLPYEVPHSTGNEDAARSAHREFYWTVFDQSEYECPDCSRGVDDVRRFEVHHVDRDPLNGHLWNLTGLCKRCHRWRHQGETLSSWSVEEWKQGFLDEAYHPHESTN
jgi:hypothetical protein